MIEEIWTNLIAFTEQFVVPDWGALVALIPIGLAAIVLLYLAWTVFRFANAGPTRRGKRRLAPASPAGIHMPGPTFAPLLAAVGFFFLVFGLVAGGIWLPVGGLILAIMLLYWGREEMRNFDRASAGPSGGAAVGALPPPRGSPPPGVHIPAPSFRPLLLAIGATALVIGIIVGGWGLLLGLIALVLVLLGWLWDARKEYGAVEKADETGHLDAGRAPDWPKAIFAALGLIIALTILLTSRIVPDSGVAGASAAPGASGAGASAAPGASGAGASAAPGGGTTASSEPGTPAADVVITAQNVAFTTPDVTLPAGKPFTLAFDNRDNGVPHDVVIKDAGGAVVYKTEPLLTGVAVVVYDVPAISAGQYTFVCTVHPNMKGTATAK